MLLAPTVESPALARAYCDGVLESYGQDEHSVDARLVVSELVTNAVLHAATEIELNVVVRIDAIRIEVTDLGIDLPQFGPATTPADAPPADEGCRSSKR